jgi:hypothetical protein
VPEFHVLLILFPAKEDLLAADNSREINQPAFQIFDEDLTTLKFGEYFLQIREGSDLFVYCLTAGVTALFHQRFQALFEAVQDMPKLSQALQPGADLRQQRPRFVARVMFVKTMFHRQCAGAIGEINTVPGTCANTNVRERMNEVAKAPSLFASGHALNGRRISGQKGNLLLPGALLVTMQTQLLASFVFVYFRLAALFK